MTQLSRDRSGVEQASYLKNDWTERWQSLKAGALGAMTISLVFSLLTEIHSVLQMTTVERGVGLLTWQDGTQWIVSCAIAALSGFLFAITYRYVVRHSRNPHLKAGAVGAFSLVRGLAQAEIGWHTQASVLFLAVIVLESFVLFGVVRVLLDKALLQGWVKPFSVDQE